MMLTDSQRLKLEKQLLADRQQLLDKLAHLRGTLTYEIKRDDEDNDLERSSTVGRLQELPHTLQAIDEALDRLQQGNYGLCEQCGTAIDPDRLEAMPETTFCLKCKLTAERTAKAVDRAAAI